MVGWTPSTKDVNVKISKNAPSLEARPPYCPYCSDGIIIFSHKRSRFLCRKCRKSVVIKDEYDEVIIVGKKV